MTMQRPIEFGESESFQVILPASYLREHVDPLAPHRHRMKRAKDVNEKSVDARELGALAWLREKRAMIEFGDPYTLQCADGSRRQFEKRPVTVEIPTFGCGRDVGIASGPTLGEAVEAAKVAISQLGPEDTYPGRDVGLDRVILSTDGVELRVADLLRLVRDYLRDDGNCVGGALHCSLEDGNLDDRGLEWERDEARKSGDTSAVLIAGLFLRLPVEERRRLYERGFGR